MLGSELFLVALVSLVLRPVVLDHGHQGKTTATTMKMIFIEERLAPSVCKREDWGGAEEQPKDMAVALLCKTILPAMLVALLGYFALDYPALLLVALAAKRYGWSQTLLGYFARLPALLCVALVGRQNI